MKRKLISIALLLLLVTMLLAACAPGQEVEVTVPATTLELTTPGQNPLVNQADDRGRLAGAAQGLWHGLIAPITVIGSFFNPALEMYEVHNNGREIDCSLSSLIHKQLIYPIADPTSLRHTVREVREIEHVDPVAIGDRVRYVDAGDGRGMIV